MITVGSDFSGIGAFNQAMNRLGKPHRHVFACDMDRYARKSYEANYLKEFDYAVPRLTASGSYAALGKKVFYFPKNVYDRQIPPEPLDIYMTSPPCQAFSIAGKRKGEDDKRGILFYNSHEFIKKNRPRFFIFENVKGLLSHDKSNKKEPYGKTFNKWIEYLGGKSVNGQPILFPHRESVPYHIYHRVLNATDYGIPQNRERVFIVGIRDDKDNEFKWPKPEHLTKRLIDVLEDEVDEKYFLSDTMVKWLTGHSEKSKANGNGFNYSPKNPNEDVANCINQRVYKMGVDDNYLLSNSGEGRALKINELIPALRSHIGSGHDNYLVKVKSATKSGYEEATLDDSINFSVPESKTRRGRVGKGVAQTLDTACHQGVLQINPSKESGGVQPYQQNRVYDSSGIIPAIPAHLGGERMHNIKVDKEVYLITCACGKTYEGTLSDKCPECGEIRSGYTNEIKGGRMVGRNPENPKSRKTGEEMAQTIEINENPEITNTISTVQKDNVLIAGFRIRRLTPRECLRLMDFPESFKIKVSDTQAYKQAGNSICVGVLHKILKRLPLK